jgi:hypothetical protein
MKNMNITMFLQNVGIYLSPQGVTTRKNHIVIFTALRISKISNMNIDYVFIHT